MSPTAALTDRAAAREAAEAHLRALVGPRGEGQAEARLREDQWSAIEALAVDRRRALVVQSPRCCCAERGPAPLSSSARCWP